MDNFEKGAMILGVLIVLAVSVFIFESRAGVGQYHVSGQVLLGPQCPVMQEGETCRDLPYETVIKIENENDGRVDTIHTNSKGRCNTVLNEGAYVFMAEGATPFPNCDNKYIKVPKDELSNIVLMCDTGVR